MGYSICVPFDNVTIRNQVLGIALQQHVEIGTEMGQWFYDSVSYPLTEVSYPPKDKIYIGYDYVATDIPVEIINRLCSCMAVKAGKRKKIGNLQIPYYIYDGSEEILLMTKFQRIKLKENQILYVVNNDGFYFADHKKSPSGRPYFMIQYNQKLEEIYPEVTTFPKDINKLMHCYVESFSEKLDMIGVIESEE